MASTNPRIPKPSADSSPTPSDRSSTQEIGAPSVRTAAPAVHPHSPAPPTTPSANETQSETSIAKPPRHPRRKQLILAGAVLVLIAVGYFLIPRVYVALNTVSTDDAYVNGHVTFVAPRVPGQVMKVLVDDNYRVMKGALLV